MGLSEDISVGDFVGTVVESRVGDFVTVGSPIGKAVVPTGLDGEIVGMLFV